jgi:hypothetical protein
VAGAGSSPGSGSVSGFSLVAISMIEAGWGLWGAWGGSSYPLPNYLTGADIHFIELLTEYSPPRFDYNVRGSVYVSFDGLFGVGPRRESGVVNLHGFCAPKRFYSYRNTPAISHRSDLRAFLQYGAEPSRFLGGSAATIKLTRYRRISSGRFQMCGMDVVGHAADREAGAAKAG